MMNDQIADVMKSYVEYLNDKTKRLAQRHASMRTEETRAYLKAYREQKETLERALKAQKIAF